MTGTGPSGVTWTYPSASRSVSAVIRIDARRGQLLHARRQVRRLAHRRVVHVQVVADRPHHHLPGVEPDPDVHVRRHGALRPRRHTACTDACMASAA